MKDALAKKGRYSAKVERRKLTLGYDRGPFARATAITASKPARFDSDGLTFTIKIPAHGEWTTGIDVVTALLGAGQASLEPQDPKRVQARMRRNLERWIDEAPRLECDREPLKATYRRSLVDLAALRFSPPIAGGRGLPAAGLPWFMTMFGRDSIFTSLQALPFTPELAATTLRALGDWQGVRLDDFRDEDPGRILHEMRYGEMTAFEERPHSPYYGCGRRDAAVHRSAGRVRALDRRSRARPRARDRGARGSQLDRRVRRSPGHWVHLVPTSQRGVGSREPVLEGLVGLDLVPRRIATWVPAGDVRAAGLRIRRQGARRAAGARDLEGRRARRLARARCCRPQAQVQP